MALQRSNQIDRQKLERGDHIYAYRKGHLYSHHGIFIGDDRVIHFNKTKKRKIWKPRKECKNCRVDRNYLRGVVKSCVDCFLDGHTLRRFQYGVERRRYRTSWPGTCTTANALHPDVTANYATELFRNNHFGEYDLLRNNCETFAVFCKTGNGESDQACMAILGIMAAVEVAIKKIYKNVFTRHGEEKVNELKRAIERFLSGVSVQNGEDQLNNFKQMVDRWDPERSSPDEISDRLRNLGNDQGGH